MDSENLPKGWAYATIPDLISGDGVFVDGDWVESKDQDPGGDVRLIQLADVGDGRYIDKSNRFLTKEKALDLRCTFLKQGDVLLARMPDPLGRACLFPGDKKSAVTVVDVCVVRSGDVGFDHRWLMHFVNSPKFRGDIFALQSGSTRKRISRGNLGKIKFPVPPVNEQIRIADKVEELLSDLDSGVAELKTAQKKLTQYRQSLLKSAVEGSLTADWRAKRAQSKQSLETGDQLLKRILKERRKRWEEKQLDKFREQGKKPPKNWKDKYTEPVQPDTTDLPQRPEGWVWASIDQCALDEMSITDGPFGSNLKSEHYTEEGPRVIRLQNIGDGEFSDARAHISTDHYSSLLKHAVKENDLVVAMLGESLPRACLIPGNVPPAIVKADCARIRVNADLVLPDFINACMNSRTTKERVVSLIKGIGRPRINLGNIRKIQIPIPPISEQVEIISVLSAGVVEITNQMSAIDVGLRQADAQRKNLLKSAFSGELVEQDLNDESARILLNRIREGRSKQKKQPKVKSPQLSKKSQKMKKTNEENLRDWIENHPEGNFSFENIRNSFTGEYESLKDEVFKLLDGKEPILKQIFDKKAGSIRFERVKK